MAGQIKTWMLDEFHGGLDLRAGDFSSNQAAFRTRDNVWTTKGKKVKRRPPCEETTGVFSIATQGMTLVSGQKYTFAKKGDTAVNALGVGAAVDVLYFDNPDYCTNWEVLDYNVYNNQAYAWIRHDYPSTAYPKLIMLHVWDLLLYAPTYVQDPHLPALFSPSIADAESQTYDSTFVPVIGQGASRLASSTLRGNTNFSGIEDARVWNQRSKDAFLTEGEEWCFVVPEGLLTVFNFLVARDASWMNADGKWAYYVLEYKDGDVWTPMEEVSVAPTTAYTWRYESVVSRFAGGWNETQLDICWGSADAGIVRFRLIAGATSVLSVAEPTVEIIPDDGVLYRVSLGDYKIQFRGGDVTTVSSHYTGVMGDNKTYLLALTPDNINFPELIDITSDFPTGWQREHYSVLKKIVTDSTLTNGLTEYHSSWAVNTALTGTVSSTASSNSVTGSGTAFTTELANGDMIKIGGEIRKIANISGSTALTTTTVFTESNSGIVGYRSDGYADYISGETHLFLDSTFAGALATNQLITLISTQYLVYAIDGQDITVRSSAGAAGDFTATINRYLIVVRSPVPVVTDYDYAYESNAQSEWYTERVLEYIDIAGLDNATSIATSTFNPYGGRITTLTSINRRFLVTYKETMQLWAIDQSPANFAHLDDMEFGTGDQETPIAIQWYGAVIVPVGTTFRAVSVVGANNDNLQDSNIGEAIDQMPFMQTKAGRFWAKNGQVIIGGTTDDGFEIRVYDYSKESKISAWSRWVVDGIDDMDINSFVVEGSKISFRTQNKLYSFNYDATALIDFNDVAGNAYESKSRLHYNDMGKPGMNKSFFAVDIVQKGKSILSFELPHYGADFQNTATGPLIQGPTIKGISYGRSRLPLTMIGQSVAIVISSRSETDWELQSISLDYRLLKR